MHILDEKDIRCRSFIDAYIKECPLYIDELKDEAIKMDVPIIMDSTRDVIKLLLSIKKPKQILELGTAIGYSTLIMSEYSSKNTKIDTVENYKPRIKVAKKNIKLYDKYKKISLYDMDVADFLKKKIKTNKNISAYDFIFLDAAKAQYIVWLPDIISLMKKGAILIADNVLRDGDILESRYTIRKRDRTIHKRMREYIYEICHNDSLDSYILDIGDGLTVSLKK